MSTTINILGYKWTPQKRVRPWALGGPILILLFCLPLLRPLRHPAEISGNELARLATVEAIVEHGTLSIDGSTFAVPDSEQVVVNGHRYAGQPATMAMLLAGSYWVMTKLGLSFAENGPTVTYILTLLGVTLPVAFAAGVIYRMARIFELRRPWRAGLGLACVIGTGLISYATVLNPHAPSAVLVLCSTACLIHVATTKTPKQTSPWLIVAGFCAALASAIDLSAVLFLVLFVPAIFALRWPIGLRFSGLMLYGIGVIPPLALHAAMTIPLTGDLMPGQFHRHLQTSAQARQQASDLPADDEDSTRSWWDVTRWHLARTFAALLGRHGLLSHFPILVMGVIGVFKIMHRHWPSATKNLAGATLVCGGVIILTFAFTAGDWNSAMFATRWFILFSPLLLFWAGSWLRNSHRPVSWSLMGVALGFSVIVSLIGATGAWPRDGFDGYTVVEAAKNMVSQDNGLREAIAGR